MFTNISCTNLLYHLIGLIYLTDRDGISWVGGSYHLLPYSIVLGSGYTRDSPTSNFDDQRNPNFVKKFSSIWWFFLWNSSILLNLNFEKICISYWFYHIFQFFLFAFESEMKLFKKTTQFKIKKKKKKITSFFIKIY